MTKQVFIKKINDGISSIATRFDDVTPDAEQKVATALAMYRDVVAQLSDADFDAAKKQPHKRNILALIEKLEDEVFAEHVYDNYRGCIGADDIISESWKSI